MSTSHHGAFPPADHNQGREMEAKIQRLMDQINGTARREYPAGRMGAKDDGALSYALATDMRHRTIIMRFGKPIEWMAMEQKEAEELRDQLTERLMELRGIAAT